MSNHLKTTWEKFYKPLPPLIDVAGLKLVRRVVALATAVAILVVGQVALNKLRFDPWIHFTVQGILYLSTLVFALLSISLLLMVSYRFIVRLFFETRVLHESYSQFLRDRNGRQRYEARQGPPTAPPLAAATKVRVGILSSPGRRGVAVVDDDDDDDEQRESQARRRRNPRSS